MRRTPRILLALALSLSLMGLAGCSSDNKTDTKEDAPIEKEEDVILTEDDVEEIDLSDEEEAPVAEEEQVEETEQATQRVGADGVGFVEIPSTWVNFQDAEGGSSLQWCDGTPMTIITLDTFDMESVPEAQRDSFTAEDAANSVWANILAEGVEEDNVQGARVELAGREALQVYCMYPDGTFLVCWLLADDAGVIHYVSAEGTEDTILDAVNAVQDTYAF